MSYTRDEVKNNSPEAFSEYQTDSLFLLIGTNPLPNYVAFRLLAKPSSHIYLIHTIETNQVADRLVRVMDLSDGRWTKIPVDESNARNIFTKVCKYAEKAEPKLGLNYTGGTKSMAVHSYRAIQSADSDAVFSYLDARKLELLIDTNQASPTRLPAALHVEPGIEALLDLHGHTPEKLENEPFHPDVCRDLITVPPADMRCWCDNNLRSGHGTPIKKKKQELKPVRLPTFGNLPTHWGTCKTLGDLATAWDKKVGSLARWFDGRWLEDYTLWSVQQVASDSNVRDAVISLESNERDFELDVVALRGYQLFAISCTTDTKKSMIKLKLFEDYVRARQLGGDEARIGVVSFAPADNPDTNPDSIKREIEEEWDAKGKFRVFGVEHLPNLSKHLQEWFNSQ